MRIIFAAEGWHLDYVGVASTAWRRFFPDFKQSLVVVADNDKSDMHYAKKYGQYVDEVVCYRDIDDVCRSALAKMARLHLSMQYHDEVVTLHDIDFCPLQRGFYEGRYARYTDGKMMFMGAEVYWNTERGRIPISATTAPSSLFTELLNPTRLPWREFVDAHRGTGERTQQNKADVLNAPWFSDEMLINEALCLKDEVWLVTNIYNIERGYDMQRETIDRACWNLADFAKMFRGEYYEAHLLKAYQPNIIVNDKEFDSWGYVPGLLPIFDYIGYREENRELAINEARKIYGAAVVNYCLNYIMRKPGEVARCA